MKTFTSVFQSLGLALISSICTACQSVDSTPVPPTGNPPSGTVSHKHLIVAIQRHMSFSQARVTSALRSASLLLQKRNSNADAGANVEFVQSGGIIRFGSEDGYPDEIRTGADMRALMRLGANVVVVPRIGECGSVKDSVAGCSGVGGDVVNVTDQGQSLDALLWAHELGHNAGLGDLRQNNETRRIMFYALGQGRNEVDINEKARYERKIWHRASPMLAADHSHKNDHALAPAVPVDEFIRKVYVHGFPFNEAAKYTEADVPYLISVLANSRRKQDWANAAKVLGVIGGDNAREQLKQFIQKGSGVLPVQEYNAKIDAILALGYAAGKERGLTLSQMLERALQPAFWDSEIVVMWRAAHTKPGWPIKERLVLSAAKALSVSGKPASTQSLRQMQKSLGLTPSAQTELKNVIQSSEFVRKIGYEKFLRLDHSTH